MSMQNDTDILASAIAFAEEADATIDAWTLDELESLADLGSIRAAWAGTSHWSA
jgi:hypothetical protein